MLFLPLNSASTCSIFSGLKVKTFFSPGSILINLLSLCLSSAFLWRGPFEVKSNIIRRKGTRAKCFFLEGSNGTSTISTTSTFTLLSTDCSSLRWRYLLSSGGYGFALALYNDQYGPLKSDGVTSLKPLKSPLLLNVCSRR